MQEWKKQVKRDDVLMKGTENDIVVLVMGTTGVGKSTFINNVMSKNTAIVSHDLKSCTGQLKPVFSSIAEPAHLQGKRLVLVDTPGFGHTYTSDSETLRRIAIWLASSYDSKMNIGGIIYLHDISRSRMLASDIQYLEVFQDLCGYEAMSSVIIATTKAGADIPQEESEKRCDMLSSTCWNEMIEAGATVYPLGNDPTSARNLLTIILQNIKSSQARTKSVKIQEEVVDQAKLVSETTAGQRLKGGGSTLKEVLEMQKKLSLQAENDTERRKAHGDNVNKLDARVNALKVPFARRLLAGLGLA